MYFTPDHKYQANQDSMGREKGKFTSRTELEKHLQSNNHEIFM